MTSWWVRIVAYDNEGSEEQPTLFVNKEIEFPQFNQEVERLRNSDTCVLRYELTRTQHAQNQVIGVFTWKSEENVSLIESLENVTALAVKLGNFKKKQRKDILLSLSYCLQEEVNVPKKASSKTPSRPAKDDRSLSKREEASEEVVAEVESDMPIQVDEGLNKQVINDTEKVTSPVIKKERPVKVKKEKKRRKKHVLSLKKISSKVHALCMSSAFSKVLKGLVLLFLVTISIVCVSRYVVPVVANMWQSEPSFEDYLADEDYQSLANQYEKEFWEWEEKQVASAAIDKLESVASVYKEPTIAFDLSFLKESYSEVITCYEANKETLRLTPTRTSFLAYSYIETGQLDDAAKIAEQANSDVIYTELGYAYLQKDKVKQAEKYSALSQDDELSKQVKDYALLKTTLTEVEKQLQTKNISPSIKMKLEESQTELQKELSNLREGNK